MRKLHTLGIIKGEIMWEFEIIGELKDKDYILFIQENMAETVSKVGGIMATLSDGSNLYLSIGAKKDVVPELKAKLRLVLCDVFCEKMKYNYLKNNIDLMDYKEEYLSTFLKVCTYFDRATERQIVLHLLDLNGNRLNLRSYLYFKMQGLLKKWQELCELTNQNSLTILKKENFIELLRFLLNSIDSKCQSVILELKDKCLLYHDIKSNFDVITSIDVNDCYDILSKLIDLNPYLIKIHSNDLNNEVITLLCSVFEDKVQLG